jgi:hypothetical protein
MECMEDINDAFASGLLFFPKTSDEEWERRRIESEERLKEYKKTEGQVRHIKKGNYWLPIIIMEVKAYHEVIIKIIATKEVKTVAFYEIKY